MNTTANSKIYSWIILVALLAILFGFFTDARAESEHGKKGRCNASDRISENNKGKGAEVARMHVDCGKQDADPVPDESELRTAVIGPDGGVLVSADGRATLSVPPGALDTTFELSVRGLSQPPGESLEFTSPAYDFGPDGLQFSIPARLTIRYDPSLLAAGTAEKLVNVYVHHPDSGRWEGLYAQASVDTDTVSALIHHFTTFSSAPDRNILIYVISDRTDSSAFGTSWYVDPGDFNAILGKLATAGFNRSDAMDEVDLPELDVTTISRYRQVWIHEGDGDGNVDVSSAERDLLLMFYSYGRSIWISGENSMDHPWINLGGETNLYWHEDTGFLMQGFGVENPGDMILTSDVTYTYSHPDLFNKITWITFNGEIGRLTSTNPDVQWVVSFENQSGWLDAPAGTYTGMGMLDERSKGLGRALFDSGWVLGYSYFRLHKDQNPAFCLNVAFFLDN